MPETKSVIDDAKGFSFRQVLSQYVNTRKPKEYTTLSPSTLGHCARRQIYQIKGIEPTTPPDEATLINFQVGFAWENIIKEALEDQKAEFDFQVPLKDEELNLSGTADFIVWDKDRTEAVLADAKTMRSQWFWYLANTNKDFLAQSPEYVMQLGAYLLMAQKSGIPVVEGRIAFISKDDGMIYREVAVELTDVLEPLIVERCEYVNSFLKSKTLPPCECTGWKIGYCAYGNPMTREKNKKGKLLNTECCSEELWKK